LDLERLRGLKSPLLIPLGGDVSATPALARDPETGGVALIDPETATMHRMLGVGESCPVELVELFRQDDLVLLSCRSQPQADRYDFRQLFSVLLDLKTRQAWQLEDSPEALLGEGWILVSDRRLDRAEGLVPFTSLSRVRLTPSLENP